MESKKFKQLVETLREDDKIYFTYKNPLDGSTMEFVFNCYRYAETKDYSVDTNFSNGKLEYMNVDKITSNYIILYYFNMFDKKTVFKLPLNEITFKSIEYKKQ